MVKPQPGPGEEEVHISRVLFYVTRPGNEGIRFLFGLYSHVGAAVILELTPPPTATQMSS